MIETILAQALKQADTAEVFGTDLSGMSVTFESGILKGVERTQQSGWGLRVICDGRLGFSSTTDPARIDDMIAAAVASARFGKRVAYAFPGCPPREHPETFDERIERFPAHDAVEEGRKAVAVLRDTCPNALTDVVLSTSIYDTRIINSTGFDASYRSSGFSHMINATIVEGDSILMIMDGGEYGSLDVRTDHYVDIIAQLARNAATTAPPVSGTLPVLMTAHEMPNLVTALELGVNGRRKVKGDSPLIGREGERVLGTETVVDNPLLDYAPGSRPFDDEGTSSSRTVLFDRGVFMSFIHDLDTAAESGDTATGNAARSPLSPPTVGTSNIVFSPGDRSWDDLIGSIDRGIVVYGVLGGGQSNLLAGDFALNVMLGFLVENGEIKGRVTDTMIAGNVYDAFGDVAAKGGTIHQSGTLYCPDILFSSLLVSCR